MYECSRSTQKLQRHHLTSRYLKPNRLPNLLRYIKSIYGANVAFNGFELQIVIENHTLVNVSEYIYLGHTIRLGKENHAAEIAAFGRLKHLLKNFKFPLNLEKKLFESCVLHVSTYNLETIILTQKSTY